nr:hypothetical protein [Tanacetum cinerariifolium]
MSTCRISQCSGVPGRAPSMSTCRISQCSGVPGRALDYSWEFFFKRSEVVNVFMIPDLTSLEIERYAVSGDVGYGVLGQIQFTIYEEEVTLSVNGLHTMLKLTQETNNDHAEFVEAPKLESISKNEQTSWSDAAEYEALLSSEEKYQSLIEKPFSDHSENLTQNLLATLAISPFHDDSYMKVMQAYNVELPIQAPIASPPSPTSNILYYKVLDMPLRESHATNDEHYPRPEKTTNGTRRVVRTGPIKLCFNNGHRILILRMLPLIISFTSMNGDLIKELFGVSLSTSKDIDAFTSDLEAGAKFSIPRKVVETVSTRFDHALHGYFIGFFFFKFKVSKGLDDVMENGPWMIRNSPIILKKWSMDTRLCKPIMLDSYTSSMCIESRGRRNFAHCLIEIDVEDVLKESLTMDVPLTEGTSKEDVKNMYDELANLFLNSKTSGSSSFTATAGTNVLEAVEWMKFLQSIRIDQEGQRYLMVGVLPLSHVRVLKLTKFLQYLIPTHERLGLSTHPTSSP